MKTEQYEILLGELAAILAEKNRTIELQNWQIESLKKKIENAEAHIPSKKIEIR